ncbi:hypothetical protein ACDQ55_13285, partial [Chitinophaga sp. 30R24]|uniref:DUF6443 domain-containing protein n=1 Tax=Chitinophaga sp. 30R24 TaxID=3248838 RepID=UPI003B917A8F
MYPILRNILFLLLLAIPFTAASQNGITIKRVLDGSKGELLAHAAITVQDSVYFDASLRNKLEDAYPVKNAVTFKLNEYSPVYLGGPFTATANVKITYRLPDLSQHSVEDTLTINYDTTTTYHSRSGVVFSNAHEVTVELLSLTCSNLGVIGALVLENEMNIKPVVKLDPVNDAVTSIRFDEATADEITVRWPAVKGADEYDLEWTYIDSSALANQRYGSPVNPDLLFKHNATRVSTANNEYAIPLIFDNVGVLYARVRAVQSTAGYIRKETDWSNNVASFDFGGHEHMLNWQSNISFAEEGKRKVVVQYFDGSLHNRQTVTKDNTTGTTLVAETMYDQQGRPVIQVLPAPTLSNIIAYTKNFNTGINDAYDVSQYDSLDLPAHYLQASAQPMGTGSGAARYYSASNEQANDGRDQYLPDAQGFPFTETVYTPDNTGRISRQSGVGPDHVINSGHETRYTYGSASQKELDALFGTAAGEESHYFKNMVQDANGQYSVTYLDMHGRTVATALAGTPDNVNLKGLASNVVVTVTDTLSGTNKTTSGDLLLSSHKSQLVEMDGQYDFDYTLVPPVLKKKDCNGNDVCYIGRFDLEIKVTDDVFNQRLGGSPVIKTISNYNAGDIISDCSAPAPITLHFSLALKKGNYEIIKSLKINEEALIAYRDRVYLAGSICTSLDEIIEQQRALLPVTACQPTCASCLASIGSYNAFAASYLQHIGFAAADSVPYRGQISAAYTTAMDACSGLCQQSTESDHLRHTMLLDMIPPSGQYANPDHDDDRYGIFYTGTDDKQENAPYKDTNLVYLDGNGLPAMVYDEITSRLVRPQSLQPQQFTAKFEPSWGDALLPLHPEYCKLLEYEKYKASQQWDTAFSTIDTYAAAKAGGFINPTGGQGGIFAPYGAALTPDPLILASAGYRSYIEPLMQHDPATGWSIYAVSAVTALCGDDNSCVNTFVAAGNIFNETTMCAGDLNMIWRSFRERYLNLKRDYINRQINNTSCSIAGGNVSVAALQQADKVSYFDNVGNVIQRSGYGYIGNLNSKQQGLDSAQSVLQRSYEANCNNYVSTWMQQLAPCHYSEAEFAEVKAQLLAVC